MCAGERHRENAWGLVEAHVSPPMCGPKSLKKEVEEGYSTVNRRICEPAEWLTATVDVTVAQP
jgi:hypothetical protein